MKQTNDPLDRTSPYDCEDTAGYQKALHPHKGWKYADDNEMLAGAAQSIALLMGIRGEHVYKWLLRWCPDSSEAFLLVAVAQRDHPQHEDFLLAIVMDRNFVLVNNKMSTEMSDTLPSVTRDKCPI